MRRAVRSGWRQTRFDRADVSPVCLGALLRLSSYPACAGFSSGARCRRHGQIDLITPGVPPRELREHVLPARREILHSLKTARLGKILHSSEIGTCADAADLLAVSSRKAVRLPPRARPHCCFLIGGARQKRAEGTLRITCASGRGQLLATAAAGAGNACSLSFQRPCALGDRRGEARLPNYRAAA